MFKKGRQSPCWIAGNFQISDGHKAAVRRFYPKPLAALRDAPVPPVQTMNAAVMGEYRRLLAEAGLATDRIDALAGAFASYAQPVDMPGH